MYFDFSIPCAHPRKVINIMKEFLRSATSLPNEIKMKKSNEGFYTLLGDYGTPPEEDEPIVIAYDTNSLRHSDISEIEFARFVNTLSKGLTKGFANITVALLHELGHQETKASLPCGYAVDRLFDYAIISESEASLAEKNRLYFKLKDERKATEWAVEWLSNAENRRKAKAFEKAFFKAWRG